MSKFAPRSMRRTPRIPGDCNLSHVGLDIAQPKSRGLSKLTLEKVEKNWGIDDVPEECMAEEEYQSSLFCCLIWALSVVLPSLLTSFKAIWV